MLRFVTFQPQSLDRSFVSFSWSSTLTWSLDHPNNFMERCVTLTLKYPIFHSVVMAACEILHFLCKKKNLYNKQTFSKVLKEYLTLRGIHETRKLKILIVILLMVN